jgi:hypothetical protein
LQIEEVHNEKISIWFRSNGGWCGVDVCVELEKKSKGYKFFEDIRT